VSNQSQNVCILKALRSGRKLTSALIVRLTGSTAPATRISETERQYGIKCNRKWLKRDGKRFMEWSL